MKKLTREKPHIRQYIGRLGKKRDYIQYQNILLKTTGSTAIYVSQILQDENYHNG